MGEHLQRAERRTLDDRPPLPASRPSWCDSVRSTRVAYVVDLGGLVIGVGCLAFSHYVLDLTSPLADNISANGVGLFLGTAFRYVFYRRLVFTGVPKPLGTTPDAAAPEADPIHS